MGWKVFWCWMALSLWLTRRALGPSGYGRGDWTTIFKFLLTKIKQLIGSEMKLENGVLLYSSGHQLELVQDGEESGTKGQEEWLKELYVLPGEQGEWQLSSSPNGHYNGEEDNLFSVIPEVRNGTNRLELQGKRFWQGMRKNFLDERGDRYWNNLPLQLWGHPLLRFSSSGWMSIC